jgi:hypothetical protein
MNLSHFILILLGLIVQTILLDLRRRRVLKFNLIICKIIHLFS